MTLLQTAHEKLPPFAKFFFVKLCALLVDYLATLFLLACAFPYQGALLCGVVLGALLSFLLQTFWVFRTDKNPFSAPRVCAALCAPCLVYALRFSVMYCWYAGGFAQSFEALALFCAYGISFMGNFLFQKFFFTRF